MAARKKSRRDHGNPLRELRKSIGLSQLELGEELGWARTTILTAEKSDPKPSLMLSTSGLGCLRICGERVMQLTGGQLAARRVKLGLSQKGLADALGYAESSIQTWERQGPPLWVHPALVALAVSIVAR